MIIRFIYQIYILLDRMIKNMNRLYSFRIFACPHWDEKNNNNESMVFPHLDVYVVRNIFL